MFNLCLDEQVWFIRLSVKGKYKVIDVPDRSLVNGAVIILDSVSIKSTILEYRSFTNKCK